MIRLALRRAALAACLAAALAPAPRAAVSPNARSLPLPYPCDVGPANATRHLATDAAGVLYVIAHCTGQVVVTRSVDGGQSWDPFVQVFPQGVAGVSIEGGTLPGHAIAAWQSFAGDMIARTTADYGATWSPPIVLFSQATAVNGMSLVAEGARYHVMSFAAFPNVARVATSSDRGGSWAPALSLSMPWAFGDLAHDAGSDRLELVADSPSFYARTSADHGASFSPAAPLPGGCCLNYSDWAIGGARLLYGVGNAPVAWRIDLGASSAAPVTGLSDALPAQRSVDADAAGNAIAAAREQTGGRTIVQWLAAGAPVASAPVVLDIGGDNPNVLACDSGSAAIAWRGDDGLVWFDKTCADGTWSCCTADTNEPPSCEAGGPHVAECAGAGTLVALDGRGSTDPEGMPLTFAWSTDCPGGTFDDATSPAPALLVDAAGCDVTCGVTLSVSDGALSSACTAVVRIEDTTAPSVAASAEVLACLWPPNHRMVALTAEEVAPVVGDACGPVPSWILVACESDQPDDGTGDGETESDCVISSDGRSVLVRSERDGARPEGRTYRLLAVGTDACGNASAASFVGMVRVPHDASGHEDCLEP